MNLLKICSLIIEYSFYGLFLLVPLIFTSATSELFELNKMWLTWSLTIIIAMAWFVKMILQRRILFCRTPLDIPIALFLVSQIISTIFSWDVHVSIWGYYSRFNGGLLSILSYIFLYYAFVSNLASKAIVQRLLAISLTSGLIVALWGLPSHFGYDPTCFLFRGTFDVSCWTADFIPRARIFSTLGQPAWLAAYLAVLIPIAIAYFLSKPRTHDLTVGALDTSLRVSSPNPRSDERGVVVRGKQKSLIINHLSLILIALFYVDVLFTQARAGILGVWISLAFLLLTYAWIETKNKKSFIVYILLFGFLGTWIAALVQRKNLKSLIINPLSLIIGLLLLITFVIGTPINQLRGFTLQGLGGYFQKPATTASNAATATQPPSPSIAGGTESANIRLNVWQGAIEIWKNNPLFGTGVETFAFAYYKYKPVGQNLTSEWNFLYNKAHNEYLNYLATTGIIGLGTYLGMICFFLTIVILRLKAEGSKILRSAQNDKPDKTLILALLAGYISILITNFFGFSVVIINIYLFMIPAFVFVLTGMLKTETRDKRQEISGISLFSLTGIFFILVTCLFLLITLFRFWQADVAYALGYNLGRAGEYQQAYPNLHKAVELRGSEPVFKDELSINNAIIAAALLAQKDDKTKDNTISVASTLAQEAINTSNEIISKSPNNAVFWKTRTRLFYTLSQVDSRYLPRALDGIEKASLLAPQDANILYNLGVLYGQNNNITKGIEALEKTVKLKPDYKDARYALGLFYHTASLDTTGKVVIDSALQKKAIGEMQYILDHISPADNGAQESIKNWGQP